MRIVFDTNVVLSALVFDLKLGWLCRSWIRGEVVPIVCRETTAELLRVLNYPKFKLTAADQETLLADYLPFAEIVPLPNPLPELLVTCRYRDDVVFIHLTGVLVSGDSDLTVLRHVAPIPITLLVELQSLLTQGSRPSVKLLPR
jgi:putative PIN family toxin of toxin-antitoxin system